MADSAYAPTFAVSGPEAPAHSLTVRVTHWVNTFSFFGLLVSGIAILISHPRLYWGEAGNVETPSLLDLPLPFVLENQNGWARYLHFLSAWACVLNGLVYGLSGLLTRHFSRNLATGGIYGTPQRWTYLAVVFFLFPLMIWTGLAMSPAIASVFPLTVTVFGGQQSARTVHFFAAAALLVFFFVHVAMVGITGFRSQLRGMITGRKADS